MTMPAFTSLPPARQRQLVADAAVALDLQGVQQPTPADITIWLEATEADLPYVAAAYESIRPALDRGDVR